MECNVYICTSSMSCMYCPLLTCWYRLRTRCDSAWAWRIQFAGQYSCTMSVLSGKKKDMMWQYCGNVVHNIPIICWEVFPQNPIPHSHELWCLVSSPLSLSPILTVGVLNSHGGRNQSVMMNSSISNITSHSYIVLKNYIPHIPQYLVTYLTGDAQPTQFLQVAACQLAQRNPPPEEYLAVAGGPEGAIPKSISICKSR